MIIPDPLKKTAKIPVRIVDGKAEYFYGGPFPKIKNIPGELVIPAFALVEKAFADECSTADGSEMLPAGTSLMVNVRVDTAGAGLRKDVTCGPLSGNVEVLLLEPLFLRHRGTKSSVLNPCSCFIPGLQEEASSLNHAYTIISKRFETNRHSNTGNVFQKLYYKADGNSWEPLQRLRERYDARFEQRFTSNGHAKGEPLILADSTVVEQVLIHEDVRCRLVASTDSAGLTIDENEYGGTSGHDLRRTIRTKFLNKVLLELIKDRFTSAVQVDHWLDEKGIPADLRQGFPTGADDEPDALFTPLDELFAEFTSQKDPLAQPYNSSGLGERHLNASRADDEDKSILVGEGSSKRLDEYLAAGWIHVGNRFKWKPLYRSKPEPCRNAPVRIRLKKFSLSKHQRRVLKKNLDVQVSIGPLNVTREEETLFHRHKSRFRMTPPKSIWDIIPESSLTEIKKVTVTKDGRLIAVGYLDVGTTSTYSMYGMFEPSIAWRSLGILTILKEIQFSIAQGKEFYYLGYVYDQPSYYDYKKRFHGLEVYDWNGNWWMSPRLRNVNTQDK